MNKEEIAIKESESECKNIERASERTESEPNRRPDDCERIRERRLSKEVEKTWNNTEENR